MSSVIRAWTRYSSLLNAVRHLALLKATPYCRIGKQPVSTPLVTLPQVRAHLSLLRAIQELRSTVEEGTDERFPEYVKTLQPPQRWIWMIGLAIDRFLKWLQTIERTDLSAWYAEDCDRLQVLRGLKSVDDYLIRSLVAVGDIGAYEPSDAHRQAWRDTCGTSWDPLNAAGDGTLEYASVPNVDDEGHGYMQNDFASNGLAVHKLVRDLVRDYRVDSELQKYRWAFAISGTLRTPKRAADIANASSVKKRLWSLKICSDSLAAVQAIVHSLKPPKNYFVWERTLMLELEYSMNEMRRQIQHNLSTKKQRCKMNNVLSAYTSDRPFSVELVGAVLRQGSFIEKMHQLGWTVQDRFSTEEDSIVLEHSIARYHAFLDLLSTSSSTLFVPTLDIDLVWHTHQLLGQRCSVAD
ncbi:hypothetical protein BC629DRAFT_1539811 [Irpex lacteus]|nr:hypothetical protein BC629DRAFT_1539811 [Irpex lacteus]